MRQRVTDMSNPWVRLVCVVACHKRKNIMLVVTGRAMARETEHRAHKGKRARTPGFHCSPHVAPTISAFSENSYLSPGEL